VRGVPPRITGCVLVPFLRSGRPVRFYTKGLGAPKKPEFDGYAGEYSALLADPLRDWFAANRFFHERKLLLLREFFSSQGLDTHKSSWVDIGCGRGDLLRLGAADFAAAAGCDVSEGMISHCHGISTRHQIREDVLPFPDHSADLATAVCVYHHLPLPNRAALTREAARILRTGGIYCVMEHNPRNPFTRAIVRRSRVDKDTRLLTVSETRQLLEAQNLQIIAVWHFLVLPERLFRKLGFIETCLKRFPIGGQYAVFARAA
jgi:SAM-dependent methyltransferase